METKICIKCGRELSINNYQYKSCGKKKKWYYSGVCKECEYKRQKEYLERKRRIEFSDDLEILVQRKYKEINPLTVLDTAAANVEKLADDEVFIATQDCNNVWVSNYGRCVSKNSKGYILLKGSYDNYGQLRYSVRKDVIENGVSTSKRYNLYVAKAVIQAFIVNPDCQNNVYIWHKGGDKNDNYYKHLYPLNQDQYRIVRSHFKKTGDDSEEFILKVMNDMRFKADDWSKKAMNPTVCGVGYWGTSKIDSELQSYKRWENMLTRCYSDKFHKKQPQYRECTVCEEWFNYYNFKKWHDEHFYQIDNEQMELDKDILFKGNKVYSPETCSIVPHSINTLFLNGKEHRGKYPLGVYFDKSKNKFRTALNIKGKSLKLGEWNNPEDAFAEYKKRKEENIVEVANEYKGKIPNKVYDAMVNWKIEITD